MYKAFFISHKAELYWVEIIMEMRKKMFKEGGTGLGNLGGKVHRKKNSLSFGSTCPTRTFVMSAN